MLEFIPEKVSRIVVMNVLQTTRPISNSVLPGLSAIDAFVGADFVVAVHNWLIGTKLRYVIFDFQDEKDVPADFLEELMQLMKRVRIPFLFTGVTARPRSLLQSYNYTSKYPIFATTDESLVYLESKFPDLLAAPHDGIVFGTPIEMVRSRLNGKPGEDESLPEGEE
jgi:hypothetical protein